jgi:predicted small metal-binding protein
MKTMTCNDLGSPCEFTHRGSTADEIIKAQDKHLRDMVSGDDRTHTTAHNEMKRRWRHAVSGMGWYRATERKFAARSEDGVVLGAARD